ncbi:HBL/NHE enterotoxin family protein [Bacillus sp. C30]|uniref:HBL/NHE enterotoxin family protein n=1 Tax=Bacillus sp. C30 TaxID=1387733 RepID=UPI00349F3C98
MKKKVVTCIMLASLATGGEIPLNVLTNPVVQAESIEELDISSSLRKLGTLSVLIQMSIDQSLKRPNVNVIEIPALNSNQQAVKTAMKKWENELHPKEMQLYARSKAFVYKFDSYYPQLKNFVDNETDQQGFLDRLETLQTAVTSNQSKIQSHINELEEFKSDLSKSIKKIDANVEAGQKLLGGSKKIDELKTTITDARVSIDKDLQQIALVPGALNEAGLKLFKEIYTTIKEIIDPVADAAMEAINKGKEIENSILEAEAKAEKEAKEAGKSESEIAELKKEAREKIEKDKKAEIAAAAEAKMKDYDLIKAIDLDRIEKMYKEFGQLNTLTIEQQRSLKDLSVQNQKIYDATKDLTIAEAQQTKMLLMQNDVHVFAEYIDREIVSLNTYKKDWSHIGDSIQQLSVATTATGKTAKLKRVQELCKQLKQQIDQLNS